MCLPTRRFGNAIKVAYLSYQSRLKCQEAEMNIAEYKLHLFRQIDTLPEESLIELQQIIARLQLVKKPSAPRQFGCRKASWFIWRMILTRR